MILLSKQKADGPGHDLYHFYPARLRNSSQRDKASKRNECPLCADDRVSMETAQEITSFTHVNMYTCCCVYNRGTYSEVRGQRSEDTSHATTDMLGLDMCFTWDRSSIPNTVRTKHKSMDRLTDRAP